MRLSLILTVAVCLILALLLCACDATESLPEYSPLPAATLDIMVRDNNGLSVDNPQLVEEVSGLVDRYLGFAFNVDDDYSAAGLSSIYPSEDEHNWQNSVRLTHFKASLKSSKIWDITVSDYANSANVLVSALYDAVSDTFAQDEYLSLLRIKTSREEGAWIIRSVESLVCTSSKSVTLFRNTYGKVTVSPVTSPSPSAGSE